MEQDDAQIAIGTATMDDAGAIVLRLRAYDGAGTIGDATISYRPDDEHYSMILEHLAGLVPGETRLVKPWP
jgi:hypothetical protein